MKYPYDLVQKASLFLPLLLKVTISKNTISNLLPQKIHFHKKCLKNNFLRNRISKLFSQKYIFKSSLLKNISLALLPQEIQSQKILTS